MGDSVHHVHHHLPKSVNILLVVVAVVLAAVGLQMAGLDIDVAEPTAAVVSAWQEPSGVTGAVVGLPSSGTNWGGLDLPTPPPAPAGIR